jgi:hypothetical protein
VITPRIWLRALPAGWAATATCSHGTSRRAVFVGMGEPVSRAGVLAAVERVHCAACGCACVATAVVVDERPPTGVGDENAGH